MEFLAVLLLFAVLVVWLKVQSLSQEVRQLKERLGRLELPASPTGSEPALALEPPTEAEEAREAQVPAPPQAVLPTGPAAGAWRPPGLAATPPAAPTLVGSPAAAAGPVPAARRPPLTSRQALAIGGALVTLGGAVWLVGALVVGGVLTRQMLLVLAAVLAAALYLGSERVRSEIGEAMRGLGYGIGALCLGALAGAGVPAWVCLLLILALSLAAGLHGVRRGRLLGAGTALLGASASVWLLADNLNAPLLPQLTVLGLYLCGGLAQRALPMGGRRWLSLYPPLTLAGLVVTLLDHDQPGSPLMWAVLLLGSAAAAAWGGLARREPSGAGSTVAAGGVIFSGLAGLAPLLAPLAAGQGLTWSLNTADLTGVGLLAGAAAVVLHRQRPEGQEAGHDRLRDAFMAVSVGTLGAALSFAMDGWRLSTRLLGLAAAIAVIGSWMRSRFWRGLGTVMLALVLLDHLIDPVGSSLVVSALALAAAIRLAGRSGRLLAALAAGTVLVTLTTLLGPGASGALFPPGFLAALAGALVFGMLPFLQVRLDSRGHFDVRPLGWAALAASVTVAVLVLVAAATATAQLVAAPFFGGPGPDRELPGAITQCLLAAALLYVFPAAHFVAGPRSGGLRAGLEYAGVALAVLGILLASPLTGHGWRVPLGLALLSALVSALPGAGRWWARAWPVLGAAALALIVQMAVQPPAQASLPELVVGALILLLLWLTLTPGGMDRLPDRWQAHWQAGLGGARRLLDHTAVQDVLLPALGLTLLGLMGRTAELIGRGPLDDAPTLGSTLVLLVSAVLLLVQARLAGRPQRWWLALATFGLAAFKLVFVDLGDLGSVARGGGTIMIGLLLLGIGQLAPRPEPVAS